MIIETILLLAQIIFSFAGAIVLMTSKHEKHNYFAGISSALWCGAMLATGVSSLVNWPQALAAASVLEVAIVGASAGLAVYSGGSIFKVARLCRRVCGL